jgi:hypothetical protein
MSAICRPGAWNPWRCPCVDQVDGTHLGLRKEGIMRATALVIAIAALGAGLAAAGSEIFNQRTTAPARQIGGWTGASTSTADYRAAADVPASAGQASDLVTFVGYSANGAGETFAQFYDELSQQVFALDRKSVDERAKNLKEQGISADDTERALQHWPTRRNVEF